MNFITRKEEITAQWQAQKAESTGILAIDIGGTKIGWGIVPIYAYELGDRLVAKGSLETPKGVSELVTAIGTVVITALDQAKMHDIQLVPAITIGSPGRFIGPNNRIIAPGSARNMGKYPDEFDNCCLEDECHAVIPDFIQLVIKNDAIAQFSAGLSQLLSDPAIRPQLLGKTVVYIGPGTGLGGGFCEVGLEGKITWFSDGHIHDVGIEVAGKLQEAEDVFSGRAFETEAGYSAKAVNTTQALFTQFQPLIIDYGHRLAQLIMALRSGTFKKLRPNSEWPASDREWVRRIGVVVLGGSIGTQGDMRTLIRQTALNALVQHGYGDIVILPIQDGADAALLGAAGFWNKLG